MKFMDFLQYLGGIGFLMTLIGGLDKIFPATVKQKIGKSFQKVLSVSNEPASLAGYFFVFFISLLFTVIIFAINGGWEKWDSSGGFLASVKSSGSLIAALLVKLLVWDYFLARKSSAVFKTLEKALESLGRHKSVSALVGFALFDIWFSWMLTAVLMQVLEHWQMGVLSNNVSPELKVNKFIKPIDAFFREIDLILKYSVQTAHYILNGAVIFYGSLFLSALAEDEEPRLNWPSIQNLPFTTLAFALGLISLIVLSCLLFASRM